MKDSTNLDSAEGIAVASNYAFVTSHSAVSMSVLDVSDKTNPKMVGWAL